MCTLDTHKQNYSKLFHLNTTYLAETVFSILSISDLSYSSPLLKHAIQLYLKLQRDWFMQTEVIDRKQFLILRNSDLILTEPKSKPNHQLHVQHFNVEQKPQ